MIYYIQIEEFEVELNLFYEKKPILILVREVKELRNKRIPLVKVLWKNHNTEVATWEKESVMKDKYLQLFTGMNFGDGIF